MKIDTLVIGLGKIGMLYDFNKRKHFNNHCEALKNHNYFNLIGGVDISQKRRKLFLKKYKLPVFKNIREAFKKLEPKMIVISTPTEKNIEIFKFIKMKKIKPEIILLEKPGSYFYRELNQLNKFCLARNIKLFVNYTRSYSKIINNFKKYLINKKFKKIDKIEVLYYKGIFNSCSHYIHFFCSILKSNKIKIKKIYNIKKVRKDYLVNFVLNIGKEIKFHYSEKKINEKIIFYYNNLKTEYFTGTSKIYDNNKLNIKNDFHLNLKNILDKIKYSKNKDIKMNLSNSLITLKTICKIIKAT